jgi:hypothetical protein
MIAPILRPAVVLAVAVLSAGACASSSDDAGPATTTPASASGTASATPSAGGGANLPADLRTRPNVVAAIADTATREKVPPEEVVIAAWSPVTWNDGSIGCPEEGMSYTQALVEGELLMLRVGTGLFQYHATTGGPFAYCATPSAGYTVGG